MLALNFYLDDKDIDHDVGVSLSTRCQRGSLKGIVLNVLGFLVSLSVKAFSIPRSDAN